MNDTRHRVKITAENWNPSLKFEWGRPEFTSDDGIGSLGSLHQAGNSIIAIGGFVGGRLHAMGSGVMVAPGLALTATHVMTEFSKKSGPVFCTFLPNGGMRAWLPYESNAAVGHSDFVGFARHERVLTSDLTLVSCVLTSDAHEQHPLMMAPLELELPLPGRRLWAVGFREGELASNATGIIPFISSGLVTACYPHGRGSNLASTCIEVRMDTVGGMSGGPVFNADGRVVGIVSTSFGGDDGLGPTYVTLIWDAMRLAVRAPWPRGSWPTEDTDFFKARDLGLAKIKGNVSRDASWNVTLDLTPAEQQMLAETRRPHHT